MSDRYENFTRSELLTELREKESALRIWKIKDDPVGEDKKNAQNKIIADLEAVVKLLEDKIKNNAVAQTSADLSETPLQSSGTPNNQMMKQWSQAHKLQLIAQDVSIVGKLVVSNLERWISEIDRIHNLEIGAEEEEQFTRLVKRQLPPTIYSQLVESGSDTKTWTNLRKYLVLNFGSKISVYQHLTKLFDLQMNRNENTSTFAAKLEEQVYVAMLHITKKFKESNESAEMTTAATFKMIGAMLLSIQIRNNHPNVYRSMLKSMDKHWCANTLAAECQDYLDRLGPNQQTFVAQPKEKNMTTSTKKKPVDNKRREKYSAEKLAELKNKIKDQICRQFAETGSCPYQEKCFRKHIKKSFMAVETAGVERDSRFDKLFTNQEATYMAETKNLSLDAKTANRLTTAYVSVTIEENDEMGLVINGSGLIDSGSSITIIPEDILTADQLKLLKPSSVHIQGVNSGNANIRGTFQANLTLGSNCSFEDITIYVSTNNIPIIIGNNILSNTAVNSFCVNFVMGHMLLTRNDTDPAVYKIDLIEQISSYPAEVTKSTEEQHEVLKTKGVTLPDNWDEKEKTLMIKTLFKHKDVFGSDNEDPGTYVTPVRIPTKEGMSKAVIGNHVPQAMESAVDDDIKHMLKIGVIEECKDPKGWNTPVYAVKKSDGSVRTVANFKPTLNQCLTDLDPWEMPNIERLFSKIGTGNKYFAKLDLKSGFWQIEIHEDDRHKTAFQWCSKTYQYRKLAFGLTSAGQIFSRAISEALSTIEHDNLSTYDDDHLISAENFQSFLKALEALLSALKKNGLKLNPKKCQFLAKEAEFLGRICGPDGYRPNPEYVEGIQSITPPTNKKELRTLIGRLTWIRQFVETRLHEPVRGSTFADIMRPIHCLTKESSKVFWNTEADRALKRVKQKLSKAPIISFVDFSLPFHLTTDASTVACGAVLTQIASDSKIKIVGVASTTLSPTQQRWSATEREAYALKFGIEKFDYFLAGRSFLCFSDHKSLQYLDRKYFKNPKIKRWQDQLSAYNFVVQYIEGESNVLADMLSRPNNCASQKPEILENDNEPMGKHLKLENTELFIYIPSWALSNIDEDKIRLVTTKQQITERKDVCCFFSGSENRTDLIEDNLCDLYHTYADEQSQDFMLSHIITFLKQKDFNPNTRLEDFLPKNDGRSEAYLKLENDLFLEAGTSMLLRKTDTTNQYLVPENLVSSFIHKAHDMCNHCGITRVEENLATFYWPGKATDIQQYVNSCLPCARSKGNYGRVPQWAIGHVKRGTKPFEVLQIDYVHMPKQRGKQYILSIICTFSRYYMAIPCANADAISAAKGLYKVFLMHRVIPKVVSSDRGTHFTSELTKHFCRIMGIQQELHVPWRPQSSGTVERAHRTLKNAIFILCHERGESWPNILEEVVSNMNAMPNRSTKISPHFVITGRHPSLRLPQQIDDDLRHTDQAAYGMITHERIRRIGEATRLSSEETDIALERRLNKQKTPELSPGDSVLLFRPESSEAKATHLKWIPGYTVVRSNNMVILVERDEKTEWVHRFHLRHVPDRPRRLNHSPIIPDIPIEHENTNQTVDHDQPLDCSENPEPTRDTNPSVTIPAPIPTVNTTNVTDRRRRSRIPVRKRKEPARFRDYVRY